MKLFDVVSLKTDFRGLPGGTKGTVVDEYDDSDAFEVDFSPDDVDKLMCMAIPAKLLNLVWAAPETPGCDKD